MEDSRATDGVEHLQAAARELVAAARSFLDVVEDVVEDPERFSHATAPLVELLKDGVASMRAAGIDAPWVANVSSDSTHGDSETNRDEFGDEPRDVASAGAGGPSRERTTAQGPTPSRATPRRVRRIAVD